MTMMTVRVTSIFLNYHDVDDGERTQKLQEVQPTGPQEKKNAGNEHRTRTLTSS